MAITWAQDYKMVIKKANGESIIIQTDQICNVSFEESSIFSITWDLINIEASNFLSSISEGKPFSSSLVANEGYYISSVRILMNQDDVTNNAYKDGKIEISEVTGDIIISAKGLNISDGVDLSSNGNANCYIVSEKGSYKFSTSTYEGNIAFLMWNELGATDITDVRLEDNYIYFNKNTSEKGNALISLKDSEGNIVWSWHIWSTDEPQFITINGKKWMDRNMGATTTTSGSSDVYGLWYNPGNPNPFPGAKYDSFEITSTPSVPDGWYVADGYGFYSSSEMPGPDKPMQLCNHTDKFGNSIYFRSGYSQVPLGCVLPSSSTMQEMMGYEPHIENGGVMVENSLFIPCNQPFREGWNEFGKYLCQGIYNTAAVDTYTFYFEEGFSKSSNYCQGAARLPIRCYKW